MDKRMSRLWEMGFIQNFRVPTVKVWEKGVSLQANELRSIMQVCDLMIMCYLMFICWNAGNEIGSNCCHPRNGTGRSLQMLYPFLALVQFSREMQRALQEVSCTTQYLWEEVSVRKYLYVSHLILLFFPCLGLLIFWRNTWTTLVKMNLYGTSLNFTKYPTVVQTLKEVVQPNITVQSYLKISINQ